MVSHQNNQYRILPVNSHSCYKFQIEIGAVTNQAKISMVKLCRRHEFMVVNLVLRGDHLSVATISAAVIKQ